MRTSAKSPVLVAVLLAAGCGTENHSPTVAAGPQAVSITPASGRGANQIFSIVYSHSQGAAQISAARVLFNAAVDGRRACYVYYDRPSGSLLLVKDSGEGTTQAALGSRENLENSQCAVDAGASSMHDEGNYATLKLSVTFKSPGFSGEKKAYLFAADSKGGETGLEPKGTWTAP